MIRKKAFLQAAQPAENNLFYDWVDISKPPFLRTDRGNNIYRPAGRQISVSKYYGNYGADGYCILAKNSIKCRIYLVNYGIVAELKFTGLKPSAQYRVTYDTNSLLHLSKGGIYRSGMAYPVLFTSNADGETARFAVSIRVDEISGDPTPYEFEISNIKLEEVTE